MSVPETLKDRSKNRLERLICAGFLLVAVGALSAYLLNEPSKDPPQPGFRNLSPPIEHFQASVFANAWNQDVGGMAKKYGEKQVELTGRVLQFQRHLRNVTSPQADVLIGDNSDDAFSFVNCLFGDTEPWQRVAPGQSIVVRGFVENRESPGVLLFGCEIVSVTGEGCPRMTADELSNSLLSGEFGRKYPWKGILSIAPHVILSGTIQQVRRSTYYTNDMSEVEIVLETTNDDEITCLFELEAPRVPTDTEVGNPIVVVGERKGGRPENPALQRCFRIDAVSKPPPSATF